MKRAIIILADDWEGLYVDGKLVGEGHHLGGEDKLFLLRMAEEYNFTSQDVAVHYLYESDIKMTEEVGNFPELLINFNETYT